MAGGRRRSLTPEERALWEQVAARATPLRPGEAIVPPPAERPLPPAPVAPLPAKPSSEPPRRAPAVQGPDPHAALERAQPHMDRRRFERLRRGRYDPEARLDLHGLDSACAHAELTRFILAAHAEGLRLVLVITGKGRGSDDPMRPELHGILRHSVPHWLAAPPLVARILQVTPAHARHGGGGAFYVALRRRG